MAVKTWFMPGGATLSRPVSRMLAQSCEGKLPSAGLLINAEVISGVFAVSSRDGLL